MTDRTPDLLDLLTHAGMLPQCPDGLTLGWRSTRPDLRSRVVLEGGERIVAHTAERCDGCCTPTTGKRENNE